jgi:iron complex transport system ATP-binding protein
VIRRTSRARMTPSASAEAGTGPALRARGVTVQRGGRLVLSDVDLDLAPGETVAVVGPNGAGKSTLLAALAGDLAPGGGSIQVQGANIGDLSMVERARRRAVMPQSTSLSFPFTAGEVVRSGRAPWRGLPQAAQDDHEVLRALEQADAHYLRERVFSTLSGGEQARVVLARTLAQAAPLMLLDEPTAALDLEHQMLVATALRKRAQEGVAALVVLHDLGLAADLADRLLVLRDGEVVVDAPPDVALDAHLLSEVYRQPVEVIAPEGARGWVVAPLRPERP